jgi:D-alanyl-D-alanine carboxypeptidase (penicillin-binding protein 5/6)
MTVALRLPELPKAQQADIAWPTGVAAALTSEEYGLLGTHGSANAVPTASMAKVITALCVLEKSPLKLGQKGPTYTLSQPDIDLYNLEIEHNGSRMGFLAGQKMSEYQALQALLIPSANNIANSLAVWTFGSIDNYTTYANQYLARHGLVNTHVGNDASGFDPSTTSSAADLAQIGQLARQNPVIMQIAAQRTFTGPDGTEYSNYNRALGTNGINGLKTGNSDQNGGGLIVTADVPVGAETVHLSGAVTGASTLDDALQSSEDLVGSVAANFQDVTYADSHTVLGSMKTAWGSSVPIYAQKDVRLLYWRGAPMSEKHTVHQLSPSQKGSVGALSIQNGQKESSVTLETRTTPKGPSLWWRLTRL